MRSKGSPRRCSSAVSPRLAPLTVYPSVCRMFTQRITTGPASSTTRILSLPCLTPSFLSGPARRRRWSVRRDGRLAGDDLERRAPVRSLSELCRAGVVVAADLGQPRPGDRGESLDDPGVELDTLAADDLGQ